MIDDERISLEQHREFLDRVRTRIQDSYGQVEIETLVGRTLQTLSLATREVGFRLGELEANRYPGARWQVSPAQADLAGRFLLALLELRQQTWLNVARDLNTMLGEDSPNVDDALYKCLGDRASYEAWLEAMRRAMDAGRRAYTKQEPGAVRKANEPQARTASRGTTGERANSVTSRENAKARKPGPTGPGVFDAPQSGKDGNREKTFGVRSSAFGVDKTAAASTSNTDLSAEASAKAEHRPVRRSLGEGGTPNSHDESPAPGNDGDSPSAQAPGTAPGTRPSRPQQQGGRDARAPADYDAMVGDWMENTHRWLDEPKGPAPELPPEVMLALEQAAPTDERSAMLLDAIRFMSRMQNRKKAETARSGGARPQVPA